MLKTNTEAPKCVREIVPTSLQSSRPDGGGRGVTWEDAELAPGRLHGSLGFLGNSQHAAWCEQSLVPGTLAGLGEAWCHLKEPGGGYNCLGHFRRTRQRRSKCQDYSWVPFVPRKEAERGCCLVVRGQEPHGLTPHCGQSLLPRSSDRRINRDQAHEIMGVAWIST